MEEKGLGKLVTSELAGRENIGLEAFIAKGIGGLLIKSNKIISEFARENHFVQGEDQVVTTFIQ